MFQDPKRGKSPEVHIPNKQDLLTQAGSTVVDKAADAVGGKVQEVKDKAKKITDTASQAMAYAGMAQQAGSLLSGSNTMGIPGNTPGIAGNLGINTPGGNTITNAAAIAASQIFGVSHLAKLTIVVEGQQILNYAHFQLSQSAVDHHGFSLVLDHDALGGAEDHQMEKAQKLMGKRILVTFAYKNIMSGPTRDFIGVITKVGFSREHGNRGNIVLKGYSPTFLLDAAPHIQSFGGKESIPLSTVVQKIIKEGFGEKYQFRVEPNFTDNLTYSCQYDETHYNYLARTAEAYGEQFYYDGNKLHFGKLPVAEEPILLAFGKDVEGIEIEMRIRHVKRAMYGYNSSNHELLTTGETKITHKSSLAKSAYEISEKTFQTPSLRIAPLKAVNNKNVEATQKSTTGSHAANVLVTTGKTSVPFLYPGCVVKMEMRKPDIVDTNHFTTLMITEVNHSVDALGNYSGYFEAIAEGSEYLPMPRFHTPKAEPQMAVVKSNKDDKGQGRVQVKFDWQTGGTTTEWIRVLTPDAGSSGKVNKNRGFVFIPEVGDQVMVGFIHNHPDRPYVMGGLFHGKVGGGGKEQNHLKTITTRSGCIIRIDDNENQGSITIKDPSGNTWYMDGNKNITVTAPENININAGKDINMTAGENLNIGVGKNMNTNIGNDNTVTVARGHQFTSNSYAQNVKKDKSIMIGGNLEETTSTTTHKATKGDILIQSAGIAKVLGKIDAKVNKG